MIEGTQSSIDSQLPQDEFYAKAYKAPALQSVEENPELNRKGVIFFSSIGAINLARGVYVGIDSYAKEGVEGLYNFNKQIAPAYNLVVGALAFAFLGYMALTKKARLTP